MCYFLPEWVANKLIRPFGKQFDISNQERIQDFVLGETKVGEGSGDRLGSSAGPGQSPGRGPLRAKPPRKLLGFEYLGSFSVNNFEAFCECDEVY